MGSKEILNIIKKSFFLASFFVFFFFSKNAFSQCQVDTTILRLLECPGDADGWIRAQGSGGSGMYNYQLQGFDINPSFPLTWSNMGNIPGVGNYIASAGNFQNLSGDSMRIIMTDDAGCSDTIDASLLALLEPDSFIVYGLPIDATTQTASDGSIVIDSVTGGTRPFNYTWVGPPGSGYAAPPGDTSIYNLDTGLYTLQILDANSCDWEVSYYIDAPACGLGTHTGGVINCYGDLADLSISGVFGNQPYIYSLDSLDGFGVWHLVQTQPATPITSTSFLNLPEGVYRYRMRDSGFCEDTSSNINIVEPDSLEAVVVINPIFNPPPFCDGEVIVSVVGGTPPYDHYWKIGGGSYTPSFTGTPFNINSLCEDNYCDSIVDGNGCDVVWCDSVLPIPPCSPIITVEDNVCPGQNSGMAALSNQGTYGSEYIEFIFYDNNMLASALNAADTNLAVVGGLNTPHVTDLYAGDYIIIMKGNPGVCVDTNIYFSVSEPELIGLDFIDGETICEYDSGRVFLVMDPTVNPNLQYGYKIDSDTITLLGDTSTFYSPGDYTYVIYYRDTTLTNTSWNACPVSPFFTEFSILENDISIDNTIIFDKICGDTTGSVIIEASATNIPLEYTLSGGVWDSSNIIASLDTGLFVVYAKDTLGCLDSVYIEIEEQVVIELIVDSILESCRLNDGVISVIASNGNAPYSYSLDSGNTYNLTSFIDTNYINSLDTGVYSLVIRDNSMCVKYYGDVFIGRTPDPKIDSLVPINETCCGVDGMIEVYTTAFDSINKFSLDGLSTFQSSSVFYFLENGEYTVTIEDVNGCVDSAETIIILDTVPDIDMTLEYSDIICYGDTNGTIKVSNPSSCYSYELWRYTLQIPQIAVDTGTYYNDLIKGYYGIIASSYSGWCVDSSDIIEIMEPNNILFQSVITPTYCDNNDSCNGSISMGNITGGNPDLSLGSSPYEYYIYTNLSNTPIGPVASDSIISTLCPDEYYLQLFDANGCHVYDTVQILDSILRMDSMVVESTTCHAGIDGGLYAHPGAGVGSYSYLWSNGATQSFINGVPYGTYNVKITDINGCLLFDTAQVIQPDEVVFRIIEAGKKPETCVGVSYDGELYVEIVGGTPPYRYNWTGNSGVVGFVSASLTSPLDTITHLTYDTITINISDTNYCPGVPAWGTTNQTIIEALNVHNPLGVPSVSSSLDSICYGSSDGFIEISIFGGDGPLEFSIDSGSSYSYSNYFPYVLAGQYDVFVKDIYGCLEAGSTVIHSYSPILIDFDSVKNINCFQGNDGYLSAIASGGTGSFTYYWIPNQDTNHIIEHLSSGNYVVMVTDTASCTQYDTISLFDITNPLQSSIEILSTPDCYDSNEGSLSVSVSGGQPNYLGEYDIVWLDADSNSIAIGNNVSNLYAGTYYTFINDSFSCGHIIDSVIITSPTMTDIALINVVDNLCYTDAYGLIELSSSGGVPAGQYFLMDSSLMISQQSTNIFDSLQSSLYSVWFFDGNNCPSDTIFDIKLGEPGKISVQSSVLNTSCYNFSDGKIESLFLGGISPYDYYVIQGNDTVYAVSDQQSIPFEIDNLFADRYELLIIDHHGCSFDTAYVITEPSEVIADFIVDNDLGTAPFKVTLENMSIGADEFLWDFGDQTNQDATLTDFISYTYTKQGVYTINLKAKNSTLTESCDDSYALSVKVEGYDTYNVFTPNNDGNNDFFHFSDVYENGISVDIFDRWGMHVYSWEGIDGKWDGTKFNGDVMPAGVYYYLFKVRDNNGKISEEKGSITLLR